jgi:hypothetical protein
VDKLMAHHFGQFKQLENYIRSYLLISVIVVRFNTNVTASRTLTRIELNCCKEETVRTLEKMLELETVPLFTQNTHYLETEGKKWLSRYSDVRRRSSQYRLPQYPFEAGIQFRLSAVNLVSNGGISSFS